MDSCNPYFDFDFQTEKSEDFPKDRSVLGPKTRFCRATLCLRPAFTRIAWRRRPLRVCWKELFVCRCPLSFWQASGHQHIVESVGFLGKEGCRSSRAEGWACWVVCGQSFWLKFLGAGGGALLLLVEGVAGLLLGKVTKAAFPCCLAVVFFMHA